MPLFRFWKECWQACVVGVLLLGCVWDIRLKLLLFLIAVGMQSTANQHFYWLFAWKLWKNLQKSEIWEKYQEEKTPQFGKREKLSFCWPVVRTNVSLPMSTSYWLDVQCCSPSTWTLLLWLQNTLFYYNIQAESQNDFIQTKNILIIVPLTPKPRYTREKRPCMALNGVEALNVVDWHSMCPLSVWKRTHLPPSLRSDSVAK